MKTANKNKPTSSSANDAESSSTSTAPVDDSENPRALLQDLRDQFDGFIVAAQARIRKGGLKVSAKLQQFFENFGVQEGAERNND